MKTVAVIFGGRSTEHDISIMTAISSVIKPLELSKDYIVHAVYINKAGEWFSDAKLKDIKFFQSGDINDWMNKTKSVRVLFKDGLTLIKPTKFGESKISVDIVFPAMHGTHGEDGELMGLLEMSGVAFVGCDMTSSAIAMDKVLAKQVTQSDGIISTPWVTINYSSVAKSSDLALQKIDSLKYPMFVKPAHLGSSIGISRVKDQEQLINAIEVAGHYDEKIIVEQEVSNLIEVTLPIIGNDELTLALLERPILKDENFFGFETKYMQGGKKGKNSDSKGSQGYSELPANIPKDIYRNAEEVGVAVYRSLGCSGIARIDMLIDSKTKKVYFNEVNPLPGGLYAHNWRMKGISPVELVTKLVDLAIDKKNKDDKYQTSFNTSYLKQF
ncbi:MAG: D-alanine--D-alanine ligase [Candidatus Saccharibacteria bacterium]